MRSTSRDGGLTSLETVALTRWVLSVQAGARASTTAVPTGGIMIHPAGKIHYDGAKDAETIVQLMGIGPTGKTNANPSDPGFSKQ